MSTHKHFDKICCVVLALVILLTILFVNGEKLGIKSAVRAMGYEERLFDKAYVHSVNIIIDDWDSFLETCTNEEYTACSVIIDNEAFKNVALRAKGNTSLTNVKNYGNNRYSLKIEFDKYDSTNTYYGLDKLCLNNIIQDNTYMKDYLTYTMMGEFGVASPLCSYVYITVNGDDWGLFLAVEGIEDSFLQRNYGNEDGDLYKPDSRQMGGGRGNGKDFEQEYFNAEFSEETSENDTGVSEKNTESIQKSELKAPDSMPFQPLKNGAQQVGETPPDGAFGGFGGRMGNAPPEMPEGEMPQMPDGEPPEIPDDSQFHQSENDSDESEKKEDRQTGGEQLRGGFNKSDGGANGSDDVKLIYTDDKFSSYSNIFENAKTDVTDKDKERLISSLKNINENKNTDSYVDVEGVVRYFVVHNFVLNFDSYTGSMIHNYYLYESGGKLSMIPWDYNLAFGGFQSMGGAQSLVNYPIDSPVSGGTTDSRPMLAWIFNNEEYTEMYHSFFGEFISEYFNSGKIDSEIKRVSDMISPYVEKDPTKFCTYEEFQKGVDTLNKFCALRAESISCQLDGTIGSTSEAQNGAENLIKADGINISDMGSMGNMGERPSESENSGEKSAAPDMADAGQKFSPDIKNEGDSEIPDDKHGDAETDLRGIVIISAVTLAALVLGIVFAIIYKRKK